MFLKNLLSSKLILNLIILTAFLLLSLFIALSESNAQSEMVNCDLYTPSWQIDSISPYFVGNNAGFIIQGYFPEIDDCGRIAQPAASNDPNRYNYPLVGSYSLDYPSGWYIYMKHYFVGNQVDSYNDSQILLKPSFSYVDGNYRFNVLFCTGYAKAGICNNSKNGAATFDGVLINRSTPTPSPTKTATPIPVNPKPTKVMPTLYFKKPVPKFTPRPTIDWGWNSDLGGRLGGRRIVN